MATVTAFSSSSRSFRILMVSGGAVAVNNMHVLRGKAATMFFNRPKSFRKSHPLKITQKNVIF